LWWISRHLKQKTTCGGSTGSADAQRFNSFQFPRGLENRNIEPPKIKIKLNTLVPLGLRVVVDSDGYDGPILGQSTFDAEAIKLL
jgi:hypothetical protein